MKKKDEEAFARSVLGAKPLKKNSILKKKIPKINNLIKTQNIPQSTKAIHAQENNPCVEKNRSEFELQTSSINKKLKKGKVPINKKIDFHGLSLIDAEDLFLETVRDCYNKNLRCILFVTGKGIMNKDSFETESPKLYYGKIRNGFMSWVSKKEVKKYILTTEQANIEHGADGAFFVYLRKKQT